jgi:hypothetical protein
MKDSVIADPNTAMIDAYQVWPRYAHDRWVGKYPESAAPVLLMNGTLDPQTPLEFAKQIAPHYTKLYQSLVVFPRAAHGTIEQSPMEGGVPKEACGAMMWGQFVADPTRPLDTSCTANSAKHHFDGGVTIAQYIYGRPSLWGPAPIVGSPEGPPPRSFAASEAIDDELRRAERDSRILRLAERLLY